MNKSKSGFDWMDKDEILSMSDNSWDRDIPVFVVAGGGGDGT